ncbi:MAG: zinc-binding alcohol dehydrogenase [Natronomonas sp.]
MTRSTRTLRFEAPETVSVESRELSEPNAREVCVETSVSAISAGTELLVYRGELSAESTIDETLSAFEGSFSYPLSYGYAAVGRVVDCGSDLPESWHGRQVFAFNQHESAFLADVESIHPVPEELSAETAALFPTAETAVNLVLDGNPRVGERVVVYGAGVVGLLTTRLLSSFPLSELVVVDPIERRRRLAADFGADRTVTPAAAADLSASTAADEPAGVDLAFELSGEPTALDDALDVVGYDGRIVVGSWYGDKSAAPNLGTEFHRERISIESSQVSTIDPALRGRWTTERRADVAFEHLSSVPTDRLVTHRIPFEDAPSAYRLLDDPDSIEGAAPVQVLLTYG